MKRLGAFSPIAMICVLTLLFPYVAAADVAEGTYTIDYSVIQGDGDSVSIANDYFEKPALLTVKNGKLFMEMIINHSEWVTSLRVAKDDGFEDVMNVLIDEESDKRTIAFIIDGNLGDPLPVQMHIQIASMEPVYDHQYTVRFNFDETSMAITEPSANIDDLDALQDDPEQSYRSFIYISIILIVAIIIAFIKFRKRS